MARWKQSTIALVGTTDTGDSRFYDASVSSSSSKKYIQACYVKKIQVWNDKGDSDMGLSVTIGGYNPLTSGGCASDGSGGDGTGSLTTGSHESVKVSLYDDNTSTAWSSLSSPKIPIEFTVSAKSRLVLDIPYNGVKFNRGVRIRHGDGSGTAKCYVTITYLQAGA